MVDAIVYLVFDEEVAHVWNDLNRLARKYLGVRLCFDLGVSIAVYFHVISIKVTDVNRNEGGNIYLDFPTVVRVPESVCVADDETVSVNFSGTGRRFKADVKKEPERFIGLRFTVRPPLISVSSQLNWRVLRSQRMTRVEVPCLSMAAEA